MESRLIQGEQCVLNFGMYCDEGPDEVNLFDRLRIYWRALPNILGVDVRRHLILPSRSIEEPTLIAWGPVTYASNGALLSELLRDAKQECCAVYYPDLKRGFLFGPGASSWGQFDKQSFHMPEKYYE